MMTQTKYSLTVIITVSLFIIVTVPIFVLVMAFALYVYTQLSTIVSNYFLNDQILLGMSVILGGTIILIVFLGSVLKISKLLMNYFESLSEKSIENTTQKV